METHEYIEFCEAVEHGRSRTVRYVSRHGSSAGKEMMGRVLSCDGRRFEVENESGRHQWPMENCEAVSTE